MADKYILVNREPVLCYDLMAWARAFENADRMVAQDTLDGDVRISTVFLGLDHSFVPNGAPLLFETMVFGGEHDGDMNRYATWAEAEAGHAAMVAMLRPDRRVED